MESFKDWADDVIRTYVLSFFDNKPIIEIEKISEGTGESNKWERYRVRFDDCKYDEFSLAYMDKTPVLWS